MLGHAKTPHISSKTSIQITVSIPGRDPLFLCLPDTMKTRIDLKKFVRANTALSQETEITPWKDALPWEEVAKERIDRYSEAGLALRGARYREGLTQKELARLCHISQENLSKMENGKRVIGVKVAKKLARVLNVDYSVLLSTQRVMP